MFVAIRKETNGSIYIDKEVYSKTETIKLTIEQFELFKKENVNIEYSFKCVQESIEKQEPIINKETGEEKLTAIIEIVNFVYVTKRILSDDILSQSPYNYTKIEIEDTYRDCESIDFNDDFTFNTEKYNIRKQKETNLLILPKKLKRLEELRKDIVQDIAGLYIADIEARKEEYRILLNNVRVLQGKEPKSIKGEIYDSE